MEIKILPDGRMKNEDAAKYLGRHKGTLANWRHTGEGPKFVKQGIIFYYKQDLDEWLNKFTKCTSTAQARLKGRLD
jgi:hypothetical protein